MPVFCDTSLLAASMVEEHPHYFSSLSFLKELTGKSERCFTSAHNVAECYSALTSMPLKNPIHPLNAWEMIVANILKTFEMVELDVQDYQKAIERVTRMNLRGAVVYDAIILQAAIKKNVRRLVTWNVRHFERLSQGEVQIQTPESYS